MTQIISARLRVEKDLVTRIRRSLKGKGEIKVQVGQQVSPEEIIGSSIVPSGFRILNLSSLLNVGANRAGKYLIKRLGERIYKGELLAYKGSWFFGGKKIVIAPTDGVLDFLNEENGELKMTFLPKKVDLPSGVYGIVEDVDVERGVVLIRTQVSKIYGVCGSGRSRDGILHILNKKDDLISKSAILPKYAEHILVGGSIFYKEAISEAISVGVGGIIAGGINAADYRGMVGGRIIFPKIFDNDIGITVVVLEGFGSIPPGDDIFTFFSDYEGKFMIVDGNKAQILLPSFSSSSLTKVKNTELPPIRSEGLILDVGPDNQILELKVGLKIRIIGSTYLSEQGTIVAIDDANTLLPSGIKTTLVTIETKRRKLKVPVANCEVIL
ncbi:hypothetical protein HY384_01680 [Candidatus Daviesbacteria bacterium]|nr:hypothetical protein [Candidatus Daviesbacteria bacterium]